jgi:hypothetical protein
MGADFLFVSGRAALRPDLRPAGDAMGLAYRSPKGGKPGAQGSRPG